jgi:UbiD family decarboxylase
MAYADLRAFVQRLDEDGELLRISEEVDWNLEIGAVSRRLCDLETGGTPAPAVLFENIRGYPAGRLLTNTLASFRRYALALELDQTTPRLDLVRAFAERIKIPLPPRVLAANEAPCKENIITGDDVDVLMFPVPQWHKRDGHRYIGTFHACITKDIDSDWVNWGMYRVGVHDRNTLGLNIPAGGTSHARRIYERYVAEGKPMPIALAMGDCPTVPIVAAGSFPAGLYEAEMAGALRGEPLVLVKAETSDLMVPANAEIVIEGYVQPGELRPEGPFGEYTGYYGGGESPKPVIHVTCISHRDDPILIGSQEGVPLVDDHYMTAIQMSALTKHHLKETLRLPGIKEVFYHPAANWDFCVVSAEKVFDGAANTIGHAVWSGPIGFNTGYADWVVVVDEDVDPSDINQVLWALVTRTNPIDDIHMVRKKGAVSYLAPNTSLDNRRRRLSGSGIVIDAGWPYEWRVFDRESVPDRSDWFDWDEEVRTAAQRIVERALKPGKGRDDLPGDSARGK